MKKQNEMVAAAAQQLSYEAPRVDVYEIQVERGFADSDVTTTEEYEQKDWK
jgi:hypothetical protein